MSVLVLTEGGVELGCEGERLQVRREGRLVQEHRLQDLDGVLALTTVGVTAAALRRLLRRGVELTFLDQRGRFLGRLTGPGARNVALRLTQAQRATDPAFCLAVARAIVRGKLASQRRFLLRHRRRHGSEVVGEAAGRLRLLAERVERCEDLDELLGVEGAGSHTYFEVLGQLITNPLFELSGRHRRPPTDPVNACLSFGYTVAGALLEGELAGVGLDPMVGFLHRPEHGRPSLALDLLEELRSPLVDATVLGLVNRRSLAPADFGPPEHALAASELEEELAAGPPWAEEGSPEEVEPGKRGAVYLTRTGRPVLLRELMAALRCDVLDPAQGQVVPLRELIRRQCRLMARVVRDGDGSKYAPFEPRD